MMDLYICCYMCIDMYFKVASRSLKVGSVGSRSGSVRDRSLGSDRSRSDRSRFGSGRFACCRNASGLLTAHAAYCYCSPLPFFFSEFARSVCGAGASQASMTIYRAKLINDLLSTRPQAYRALTHHLEPTSVSG